MSVPQGLPQTGEGEAAQAGTPAATVVRGGEARSERTARLVWSLAGAVLFVVAWELAAWYFRSSRALGERLFPSWTVILTDGVRQFDTYASLTSTETGYPAALDVLGHHSVVTAWRVFLGCGLGVLAGVAAGLSMAYSRLALYTVGPILNLLRAMPLLALIPLFVLWFSGRDIGIVLFIAFAVFVIIVVATFHAAEHVPEAPARFARTLGASQLQVFRAVIVPGMVPELFAAVRIALALSWSFALGGEFTGAQEGLGWLMIQSERNGFLGSVVVLTLIFTVYAVVVDVALFRLRRSVVRWQP